MNEKRQQTLWVLTPDYIVYLRSLRSALAVGSELTLSLLPAVVLALVVVGNKPPLHAHILAEPEWSFISAVLFGQAIVKFVAGTSSLSGGSRWEYVIFTVALLLLIGVVPSMVVLVLILLSPAPPFWLQWLQIVLFLVAVVVFFILGTVGHNLLTTGHQDHEESGA